MGDTQKKLHVLVVDDEAVARNVVCRMLKILGHNTIAARNAKEALECLSNDGDLNCLLTDINMPDMDGWELALRVKTTHPCMRIVAITGEDPGNILPRLNGSGISQALFKPFHLDSLKDALATIPKADAACRTKPGKKHVGLKQGN